MSVLTMDQVLELADKELAKSIAEDEAEGLIFSDKEKAVAGLYMNRGQEFIVGLLQSGALTFYSLN